MTEKVRLKEKIGYGFGDAASSMFWKVFSTYLAFFYTEVFGISAAAVGHMFFLTRFWDTANDPFMGVICDRTNSKYGKFRPYLLWMAIPFGIIGVILFTTPNFGITGKLIYAYISYTLMMMAYTAINVPYASLLGVMSGNTNERTTLASYRMVFAFGGSLLVFAIFQPLVSLFKSSFTEATAYQLTMVVVGGLAVLFFFFTFSWTRERIKVPKEQDHNLKEDLINLLKNKPWFILLGAGIMTLIFNSVRDGVALYYFKYFIIDDIFFSIFTLTITFSTAYLFWGQAFNMIGVMLAKTISAKIGKRKTFLFAMLLSAILSSLFFICDRELVVLLFVLQALVSFCAGIVFPLLWSMYADTADYSELKTGRRATGLIFSASSMTQKFGWTIGGYVTMMLLTFYGFNANVDQTPETINGLKVMISFIPGIAALLSGVFIFFYQLSDEKVKEITETLEAKRAEISE
jgi:glycoside/pentoside/hexuronide:cation symporter, GPH family